MNSRGEREIAEYMRKHKIRYEIQYGFNDLVSGSPLKFDFAIFDNSNKLIALIEYQGEQHFKSVDFFGGEKKFARELMNDKLKRIYCKNKGIKLIEIPYWDSVEKYLGPFVVKN